MRPVVEYTREQALEMSIEASFRVPGNIIEFGVFEGASTRAIVSKLRVLEQANPDVPRKTVYACDSFEGLPEQWETLDVGTFKCEVPSLPGAAIVKGFFEDSLTPGLAQRVGKVAFASLDADLYSSTLCALTWLTPLLGPGSLLLFDEYLGDNRAEQRAHVEWQQATGTRTEEIFRHYRVPVLQTPDERVLFRVIG